MFGGGCALLVTGIVWATAASQTADAAYKPFVREPAFAGRGRPEVLIDDAHFNVHTLSGTYAPFAELLRRDGFWVRRTSVPLSSAALRASFGGRFGAARGAGRVEPAWLAGHVPAAPERERSRTPGTRAG